MDGASKTAREQSTAAPLLRLSGPLLTIAVALAIELFAESGVPVTNLGLVLLAPIVYSVLVGGMGWGSASMSIALGYYWFHYWPLDPARAGDAVEETERLVTTVLIAPAVVLSVGFLKERVDLLLVRERRARQESEAERRRLSTLLERIGDGFIAVDRAWRCTFVNARAERLVGKTSDELLGRTIWETLPDLAGSRLEEEHRRALSAGVVAQLELYYAPLARWFEVRAHPSPDGLSIFLGDVTRERETADALAVRLRQQAAVAELGREALRGASVGALLQTAVRLVGDGLDVELAKVLEAGPSEGSLFLRAGIGWREGLVGHAWLPAGDSQADYTLRSDEPVVVEDLAREPRFSGPPLLHEHGVTSGISVIIHGGGDERPFGVLGAHTRERRLFTRDDVNFMQSVANVLADAVERAHVREALRESEWKFRQIAESLGTVLFMIAPDNRRIYYVNPAYESIWGRSEESLYADPRSWLDAVHDEDRARAEAALSQMAATGHYDQEFRIVRPDGQVRWIRDRTFPVHHDGRVLRVVGIAEDVTAVKLAEERRRALLEAQSARATAEASVRARDEIIAFVSHDLRSPLSVVKMAGQVLRDSVEDPSLARCVESIHGAVGQMNRLVEDLLTAARMDARGFFVAPAPHSAAELVLDAVNAHEPLARDGQLALTADVAADLPLVCADRARVLQAISNLITNAIKFTPAGGSIAVRVGARRDEVVFSVEDTGPGVSASDLPHLFDRFWQAERADRRGAGLGLAITKGLVEAHGGRIWVESSPPRGSRFYFTIPTWDAPRRAREPSADEQASHSGAR